MSRWRRVTRLSSLGNPFECWEPVLSRVPDFLLDSVIYLYPSQQAARSGMKAGGTGFLVREPASVPGAPSALYAVTNSHVIKKGAPVVRLNNKKGTIEVLPLARRQWVHHLDGDDIAVCPIGLTSEHQYFALDRTPWFMTEEEIARYSVGPGDNVFFIGRFISQQGRQSNTPTVRQGTVSMLPHEKIPAWDGTLVDTFLVEAHSLSGYSGSPVFVNREVGSPIHMEWDEGVSDPERALRVTHGGGGLVGLIGIDCGHYRDFQPVLRSDKETPARPELWVKQNTGITCVAPIWKLAEMLQSGELARMRREREEEWVEEHGGSDFEADTETETGDHAEFQRFEDLAGKLFQVPGSEVRGEEG